MATYKKRGLNQESTPPHLPGDEAPQDKKTTVGRRLQWIVLIVLPVLAFWGFSAFSKLNEKIVTELRTDGNSNGDAGGENTQNSIAIRCSLSGFEQSSLSEYTKKPVNREDVFIVNSSAEKIMSSEYTVIESEFEPSWITMKNSKREVNELDRTGDIDEDFYLINRKTLEARYGRKYTTNYGGGLIKSFLTMMGSCAKIPLPKQTAQQTDKI